MGKFRNGIRTTLKQLYFLKFLYMRWYVMYMQGVTCDTILVLEVMDILVGNYCNTTARYIVCIRKKIHNDGKICITCKIHNPTL